MENSLRELQKATDKGLPAEDYDRLSVDEASERMDMLLVDELYEERYEVWDYKK